MKTLKKEVCCFAPLMLVAAFAFSSLCVTVQADNVAIMNAPETGKASDKAVRNDGTPDDNGKRELPERKGVSYDDIKTKAKKPTKADSDLWNNVLQARIKSPNKAVAQNAKELSSAKLFVAPAAEMEYVHKGMTRPGDAVVKKDDKGAITEIIVSDDLLKKLKNGLAFFGLTGTIIHEANKGTHAENLVVESDLAVGTVTDKSVEVRDSKGTYNPVYQKDAQPVTPVIVYNGDKSGIYNVANLPIISEKEYNADPEKYKENVIIFMGDDLKAASEKAFSDRKMAYYSPLGKNLDAVGLRHNISLAMLAGICFWTLPTDSMELHQLVESIWSKAQASKVIKAIEQIRDGKRDVSLFSQIALPAAGIVAQEIMFTLEKAMDALRMA